MMMITMNGGTTTTTSRGIGDEQQQQQQDEDTKKNKKKKPNRMYLYLYNRIMTFTTTTTASIITSRRHGTGGGSRNHILVLLLLLILLLLLLVASLFIAAYTIFWLYHHLQCYIREAGVVWVEGPSHYDDRATFKNPNNNNNNKGNNNECPKPNYVTILQQQQQHQHDGQTGTRRKKENICMTSLIDGGRQSSSQSSSISSSSSSSSSWPHRLLQTMTTVLSVRCRDFDDNLSEIVFPNFHNYARKHGYYFYDASHLIDTTRPPAWSKIVAVQHLLSLTTSASTTTSTTKSDTSSNNNNMTTPLCDWVFWLDADILIMNSSIKLESILPATYNAAAAAAAAGSGASDEGKTTPMAITNNNNNNNIDLIVTHDRKFTANSGSWMIRNTNWSNEFLNDWWNMKSWVRRKGLSLSGDNAAFGDLIVRKQKQQSTNGDSNKIAMPSRCNFNSFGVFMTQKDYDRITKSTTSAATSTIASSSSSTRVHSNSNYEHEEWYIQSDKFYYKGDFIVHASGIDKKTAVLKMMADKAS